MRDSVCLVPQDDLARLYLDHAEAYTSPLATAAPADRVAHTRLAEARSHLFKMLHAGLHAHAHLRDDLLAARSYDELRAVADAVKARSWAQPAFHTADYAPDRSWYHRHRSRSDADSTAEHGASEPMDRERVAERALQKRAARSAERRRRFEYRKEARSSSSRRRRAARAASAARGGGGGNVDSERQSAMTA